MKIGISEKMVLCLKQLYEQGGLAFTPKIKIAKSVQNFVDNLLID